MVPEAACCRMCRLTFPVWQVLVVNGDFRRDDFLYVRNAEGKFGKVPSSALKEVQYAVTSAFREGLPGQLPLTHGQVGGWCLLVHHVLNAKLLLALVMGLVIASTHLLLRDAFVVCDY